MWLSKVAQRSIAKLTKFHVCDNRALKLHTKYTRHWLASVQLMPTVDHCLALNPFYFGLTLGNTLSRRCVSIDIFHFKFFVHRLIWSKLNTAQCTQFFCFFFSAICVTHSVIRYLLTRFVTITLVRYSYTETEENNKNEFSVCFFCSSVCICSYANYKIHPHKPHESRISAQ